MAHRIETVVLDDLAADVLREAREAAVEKEQRLHLSEDGAVRTLRTQSHVLRALLANDGDPNAADSDARTALHYAAGAGHTAVVTMLLNHGANRSTRDRWGETPAQAALSAGHLSLARHLTE